MSMKVWILFYDNLITFAIPGSTLVLNKHSINIFCVDLVGLLNLSLF